MSEQEDPKALSILFVGLVSAVAVFLIVVLLQIVFYRMQEMETAKKVVSMAPEELATLRAQQQARLNGYGWVDEGAGVARIPVERAMELVADEQARRHEGSEWIHSLVADPELAAALDRALSNAEPIQVATEAVGSEPVRRTAESEPVRRTAETESETESETELGDQP